ncbi:AAA family ATPase [Lactobacillus sp. PV037]|uniref:ATP-binding protein n=1 Tax=Lactobacillus sp. PV037 TaxID=2594496 RepID=UPI00223F91FA|nr:ATP-binding protein [Lactobacillus sp. PV037]QNQ83798.1 AAA family ATPase [Lactobacillus sp. PV037]
MEKIDTFTSISKLFVKLPKYCSKHPDTNLIKLPDGNTMCTKCQQEKVERKENEMVNDFLADKSKGYLRRYSLVEDSEEYDCTFSNFKATEGTKEAKLWNNSRQLAGIYLKKPDLKMCTIFYGTPGAGKTHLAMGILNAINDNAEPPQKCLFLNTNRLYQKLKDYIGNEQDGWSKKIATQIINDADLVVLDDLGSESAMRSGSEASNFWQTFLYDITSSQKRIITTTNLTQDQLLQTYNPKIVSRLRAGSKGFLFDFAGIEDKRW